LTTAELGNAIVITSALLTESTRVALNFKLTTELTVIVVVGVTEKLLITFGIKPLIVELHSSSP